LALALAGLNLVDPPYFKPSFDIVTEPQLSSLHSGLRTPSVLTAS
jgi:hypothetical protein